MNKCLVIIVVITAILTSCAQSNPQAPTIGNEFGALDEGVKAQIEELIEESEALENSRTHSFTQINIV